MFYRRIIHGTRVFQWSEKELPSMICSTLKKMYHSPTDPVKRISSDRAYIVLYKDVWKWEKVKWGKEFRLNYKQMPTDQPDKLILLEDFRGGVDGRVWLACTTKGEMCAIKFDHLGKKSALEEEASRWRTIWEKKDTRVVQLGGEFALMMPYMKHVEDWSDPIILEAVHNAAKTMAKKGYVHKDLHRRHVGYSSPVKKTDKNQAEMEVIFFDLRTVEKMEEDEALTFMVEKLDLNK